MNTIVSFFENQVRAEGDITRKFLKILPEDKYDWKPHPKSMTLGVLATHIAELPSWIPLAVNTSILDFAAGDYQAKTVQHNRELQEIFEHNQQQALEILSDTTDEFLQNEWTMCNGEEIYMKTTKEEVVRMTMSQTIHHRAQLGVFLRLLNIAIPGSYGPSADEMGF